MDGGARRLTVTVFCGARLGHDPLFSQAIRALGSGLAEAGFRLAYGGGGNGLMGALADAVLANGGEVLGIVPNFMVASERLHPRLTQVEITDSLHSRKQRMFEVADAFISMPGGLGTLDETVEVITWRQLGLHDKPILICDVLGSATPLVTAVETAIRNGFALPRVRTLFELVDDVPQALAWLSRLPVSPDLPSDKL